MTPVCVIILAGGRSTRMGTDKAQVRVEGIRLIDATLSALSALPTPTTPIVVSPFDLGLPPEIPTVCENPPFGGPVAGIAAGLEHVDTDLVAVLAVDAPRSAEAVPSLIAALNAAPDEVAAAVAVDVQGFIQPLCALWRKETLLAALEEVGTRDVAAKALYRAANNVITVATRGAERDYDTPEELAKLGRVEL